jgi:sugar phosphate isomerase/epimerase
VILQGTGIGELIRITSTGAVGAAASGASHLATPETLARRWIMGMDGNTSLTRRAAIRVGLAAAGVTALGGRLSRAADDPKGEDDGYAPFKMGLQSYSLRAFDLEKALDLTKQLGLHYWESFPAHIPTDPSRAAEFQATTKKADVKVIGYGVMGFSKDHDANRKAFEFAKAMGIEYLSADPSKDAFDSLDKLVDEYKVAIGIHNHGPGHQWAKIDAIADAIKDHHKLIGCCIDAGHFLRSEEDPVRAVEVFDDRIYGVHLKDVKDAKTFTLLGDGDLRVQDMLAALAKRKYRYCLALEYEENPDAPMDDIKKCLEVVRNSLPKA